MDACVRDVRIALRGLRRSPGFAVTAILMLGVGIGAVTMIFAEVNAVFLKMLPVAEPENLRRFSWTSKARAFAGPQFVRFGDAVMARGGTLEGFPYSLYLLMKGAQSILVVAIGIVVGTIGAAIAARGLATILFGVSPGDPWILASSGILLLGVAVIAMTRPVTRACRINPLEALREE